MIVVSAIATTFFLGGWLLPFGIDPPDAGSTRSSCWPRCRPVIFLFIWIRATLPRLRYDQLMSLRLEGPAPAGDAQRPRDRDRRGGASTDAPATPATTSSRSSARPEPGRRRRRLPRLRRDPARDEDDVRPPLEGRTTIQYPEEKAPVYPRFRGRHKLHKFEDTGLEKCVGCSLCAAACPADCIRVVAAENTPENRVSRRRALRRGLRDQPVALHLLRLLRGRVPVRRDHHGPRLRDVRLQPRRTSSSPRRCCSPSRWSARRCGAEGE